jgi:hypothetical protein
MLEAAGAAFDWLSIIAAAAAAILWFLSAKVPVPKRSLFSRIPTFAPLDIATTPGFSADGGLSALQEAVQRAEDAGKTLDDLSEAVKKQSRFSGWAAIAAALSAATLVLSHLLPSGAP